MLRSLMLWAGCCSLAVSVCLTGVSPLSAAERPVAGSAVAPRAAWNTSRVKGSPEPPLPYRAERVYPHLGFSQPTVLTSAPGTERLFVAQHQGKIFSVPDDREVRKADDFLDAADLVKQLNSTLEEADQVRLTAVYGMTFHPEFATNRRFYVCYVVHYASGKRGQHPDGTRVVELKADDQDPPRAIVESEKTIITWLQGGHNGGCLKFGPDGCLYISTGDGGFAFPPDGRNSGQDVTNLLSAVLRINVDQPQGDRNYSIPADNPFVSLEGARGEIWAYGMRNPWKMSFDRKTGNLWVGDVGWELWELVYNVKPGDNYGWSLVEGPQPVHSERKRGPTPITPPVAEIPHTEGASITGGFVYRGERLPELQGQYIFGDWETRRFWGIATEGENAGQRRELVEPTVRIVGFAERNDGELLLLDYDDGSIHRLVRNEVSANREPFPRKLSETGLFDSVPQHSPAAGVVPFSINAAQWSDHATGERWLALPGTESVTMHEKAERVAGSMFSRRMDFPTNSVLMKTLSLEQVQGNPATTKKIETQILHFNGYDWRGYSYRWNDEQTDAELVESAGATADLKIKDASAPGGQRLQKWRFPSRMECVRCHNPWAEFSLAFNPVQLNRTDAETGLNQMDKLRQMGVFEDPPSDAHPDDPFVVVTTPKPWDDRQRLTDPHDETADLRDRARSYIHVNCAHCHRFNGGGSARIHVPFDVPFYKTEAVDARPTQGTFGIHDAMIIAPGDPYRSVLYLRMAKAGPGHMPHLGASLIDRAGLELVHDWIHQLPPDVKLAEKLETLIELDEPTVLQREQEEAAMTRWKIARRLAAGGDREHPSQADMDAATTQAAAEASSRASKRKTQRETLTGELLADARGAILLARATREGRLPDSIHDQVLAAATAQDNVAVRDLFEPFLPDDQKIQRLGDSINAKELLQLAGDANRGRDLFLNGKGIQCRNCHRAGSEGKPLGPDLDGVGKRLNREKLLESLLEPSRSIEPKYAAWLIETAEGKVFTGLLVKRTDEEVILRDTQNKEHHFKSDEIDGMYPQRTSLMPERLLREMTAQQVADLLAWLETLKTGGDQKSEGDRK